MSTTSTGSQTAAPERQAAPAAASDQTDFSPPKTSTWSEIAGKCWQDGVKECIASAGQKFGDLFGVGSAKQQDLIKQGTIPDLTLVQSGADMRIGGTAEARIEELKEGETPGKWKSPLERKYQEGDKFKGVTSVYWQDIHTASGVRFNKNELSAASREFPFGTVLKVRNPENGLETRVVITDHGPFAGKKELRPDGSEKIYNRVLDISLGAANAIGMKDKTPRAMEISVESIPENRAWGDARRNLKKDEKTALLAQVKRITEEGRM